MNTNIRSRNGGADRHGGSEHGWTGNLGQIDMQRADLHDADPHRYRVPPGIARLERRSGALVVRDGTVRPMAVLGPGMVMADVCGRLVLMHRGTMMMARMIVAAVLVDVQRRQHCWHRRHSLNEHECEEPAHGYQSTTMPRRLEAREAR